MNQIANMIRRSGRFVAVVALVAAIIVYIFVGSSYSGFHDAMMNGKKNGLFGDGSLFVLYDSDKDFYSTQYIAAEYAATKPEDVRYVIFLEKGETLIGEYSGGINAYQRWIELSLYDCHAEMFLRTQTIMGKYPPKSISRNIIDKHDYYASAPASAEISNEILKLIQLTQ